MATAKKKAVKRKPMTEAQKKKAREAKARQQKEAKRLVKYAKDTLGTTKVADRVLDLKQQEKEAKAEMRRLARLLENNKKVLAKQIALEKAEKEKEKTAGAQKEMDAWLKENKPKMRELKKSLKWDNQRMVKALGLSRGLGTAKKDESVG